MNIEELQRQLHAALLTTEELGPGFEGGKPMPSEDAVPLDRPAGVMQFFSNPEAKVSVTISLGDAETGSPRQMADAALFGVRGSYERDGLIVIEEVDPPPFGEGGVRHRTRRTPGSELNEGDDIVWRHGPVLASVGMHGRDEPDALEIAAKQHAKLVAVFRATYAPPIEPPVPPIPRTDCPPSHPIKAVRTDGGTLTYYRPMDDGYDEAIAEACFNSESSAQRSGYRRATDRAPWTWDEAPTEPQQTEAK